jgi:prolipoprotein diacylglyceryltransferase
VLLGVLACLWLTDRRYTAGGGTLGFVFDLAILAVPLGLIGGRLYAVLLNPPRYFGAGRDWASMLRIWDGGFGLAGGVAAAALGAWLGCRRARVRLSPVAGAAVPGLAVAAALAAAGDWFSQQAYGHPTAVPWAVQIAPARRYPGYENYTSFQPVFFYQAIWDLLTVVLLLLAARRVRLSGDRLFAAWAGLQAAGTIAALALETGPAPHLLGLKSEQAVMIVVLAGAAICLYLTRARTVPRIPALAIADAEPSAVPPAVPGAAPAGYPAEDGPARSSS